jgi:hypothetical protein
VTDLRAADSDRERVVTRLRRAHDAGRIDLFEFDERTAAAYAARTYADLGPLTSDLPEEPLPPAKGRAAKGYAVALRIETAAWAFAGAMNLLIWAIVSVAGAGAAYPWWIWVVGPWGLVLAFRAGVERIRARVHTRF